MKSVSFFKLCDKNNDADDIDDDADGVFDSCPLNAGLLLLSGEQKGKMSLVT